MGIIKLSEVTYTYRNKYQTVHALRGIDCEFEIGSCYAVVGKSGSGKTTMLSLMAGLDLPTTGSIFFEGVSTADMDLDEYRRNKVSVIYQSFHLFGLLTALENVMYPLELRGMDVHKAKEIAKGHLLSVGINESQFGRFPGMLSGGEQQRVAIARALASDTKLILADEPTGNLDTENSENIIDLLCSLAHDKSYCVIIITHDMGILPKMDYVYRITDGHIEAQS